MSRPEVRRDGRALRIGWGESDWLGPIRAETSGSVVAESEWSDDSGPTLTLRLTSDADLSGLATGSFATPGNAWTFSPDEREPGGAPEGAVAFGFQYCEFAMPTLTDASMQGWFLFPARPALVLPMMLIAPDGRTLLIAPMNAFHEQVMAVESGLRCGWHGDLDTVPEGFTSELTIWAATSPRNALRHWATELRRRHTTVRPGRYADDLNRKPSYWTDNGAAYWYRTEPGYDVAGGLVATVDDLRARGVPFSTVQLDSWFYRHETLRPFDTSEWVVPPSGLMEWDGENDILRDGVVALRERLGNPPLTTHCRHLSATSPYVDQFDCWVDGDRAHPKTAALYERWFDQAVQWGVTTYEHDWLIECFLGVRGLREAPGRARAWQEGIDRAAGERGLTLQWCMPTFADLCQTVTLANVTSVRTSGDHGYLVSAGYLWAWFLYVNTLADALGLRPFKDVFKADGGDPDAHCDVEALLSALSTGPVGIGDRLGRADPAILRRTCRADGMLVKPHTPIAAIDKGFLRWATRRNTLLTGTAQSMHVDGTWIYAVTLNCTDAPANSRVALADLGIESRVLAWDWRTRSATVLEPGDGWDLGLESLDWDYRVLAPIVDGVAVIGDPALYATVGDMRVGAVTGRCVTLLGAGETVELISWTEGHGVRSQSVEIPRRGWIDVTL